MTALTPVQSDRFTLPHPRGEGHVEIAVAAPAAPLVEGQTAPILFVLDGDLGFAMAAELVRFMGTGGRIPAMYVVGVGYGADFAAFAKLRTPDLTPPPSGPARPTSEALAAFVGNESGNADRFLDFLTATLAPEIARRYPRADAQAAVLFGHSLSGLFAAYALLTRPQSFAGYIVSSPSLWWDGFAALRRLEGFAGRLGAVAPPPRVLVAVGGREQDPPTEVPPGMPMALADVQALVAASRMVDAAAEFADALRAAGLADVAYACFEGEDHTTVVAPAFIRGLDLVMKPR